MQSEQAAEKLYRHARTLLGPHVRDKPGLSGYLVSLVHLVDLVYLVGLVQPNNRDRPDRRDRPNRPHEQDRLPDFFSILQGPISSVEEGATAPLPQWPSQHHSCREGLPS